MSMTVEEAKVYISRIIGGANTPGILDMAGEAIQRAYADWQSARFWTFLLKDTSSGKQMNASFTAVGNANNEFTPVIAGTFNGLNIGQPVTGALIGNSEIGLSLNYIKSFTYDSLGNITKLKFKYANTLAAAGTVALSTSTSDIYFTAGQSDNLNVPDDLNATYTARLIGPNDKKMWLKYVEQRHWDKTSADQTITGQPEAYTIYNPVSQASQFGMKKLQIFPPPNSDGVLRLRYFRNFYTASSNIDVPDDYLYKFLDYARALLLEAKRAQDDPNGYRASVMGAYAEAQQNDEQPNDDDDGDQRLKSPYEAGAYRGPIVNNGQFDPYPY